MNDTKKCTKCGESKIINVFVKDNRVKSGYGTVCKPCRRIYETKRKREKRNKSLLNDPCFRGAKIAATKRMKRIARLGIDMVDLLDSSSRNDHIDVMKELNGY